MAGRTLIPEASIPQHYLGPGFAQRRRVLRETLEAFSQAQPADHYHRIAAANLERWRKAAQPSSPELALGVVASDWGDATLQWTRHTGQLFAVLNMANAYVPGGGYVEGCPAQEENMFRRTDCHFSLTEEEIVPDTDRYCPHTTDVLNGVQGRVYLDTQEPRVCIRGPEETAREDLGYPWLPEPEIFPFLELRAAAMDLRQGASFDPDETRKRIAAQLDTLREADVKHAILSAFGCGAFCNPATEVAQLYREQIDARREDFRCIVFAIFYPGYGPDNASPFAKVFRDWNEGPRG